MKMGMTKLLAGGDEGPLGSAQGVEEPEEERTRKLDELLKNKAPPLSDEAITSGDKTWLAHLKGWPRQTPAQRKVLTKSEPPQLKKKKKKKKTNRERARDSKSKEMTYKISNLRHD